MERKNKYLETSLSGIKESKDRILKSNFIYDTTSIVEKSESIISNEKSRIKKGENVEKNKYDKNIKNSILDEIK
jgi:hypothetical protein